MARGKEFKNRERLELSFPFDSRNELGPLKISFRRFLLFRYYLAVTDKRGDEYIEWSNPLKAEDCVKRQDGFIDEVKYWRDYKIEHRKTPLFGRLNPLIKSRLFSIFFQKPRTRCEEFYRQFKSRL